MGLSRDRAMSGREALREAALNLQRTVAATIPDIRMGQHLDDAVDRLTLASRGVRAALSEPENRETLDVEAADAVLEVLTNEGWVADPDDISYNLRVAGLVVAAITDFAAEAAPPNGLNDDVIERLREEILSILPWYDEANPDYTEIDNVLRSALQFDRKADDRLFEPPNIKGENV